jgi:hypothetical protein
MKTFKTIFDIMFIMILCFATLLATMLMQGGLLVGGEGIDYRFNPGSFALTFGVLALYFFFILKIGRKELKNLIEKVYKQ